MNYKSKTKIKKVYYSEQYKMYVTVYEEEKPSFVYKKMLQLSSRHAGRHNSLGQRV